MKIRDKIIFIIITLLAFASLIYLVRSVLTPFICSLIIAYFLDPLVDRLHEKYRLSRLAASALILGLFLAVVTILSAILLPIICAQFVALINSLPQYFETFANNFYPQVAMIFNKAGFKLQSDFSSLLADENINSRFIDLSKNIFANAVDSSLGLINILSLIFITPILVFYLLKDWDILIKKIHDYLPRNISKAAGEIAVEIDLALSGYVRGQFNVCFILGLIYSSLLSFSGLNFGFLIGFLTGLFSFIPYIGMFCGVMIATLVALFQWGFDSTHLTIITAIFIGGQIIESNFLTPKLIGAKIGLHPVWMIFGLFFFGTIFGIIGVIIAVPLTAVCGTIIKHFAVRYKKSFT